jgi:undecaprenyl pyrophosphate synthase
MHSQVQYYVIVAGHGSRAASGLARRRYTQAVPVDETLRRDLSWQADSAIVEWEYGDLDAELIKISDQEAENLTQAFRSRLERAT